ncbi:3-hydroxyacyl-CoA dehydrogenase NAD-binding domain-containing protein [Salinibacter ruber]|uniref:3-hydroxyacyl-CoA dehydrogenase NAD-binding domain-containing protein n=1 Tax=Salinibacter ruber TaxID=146919 RepID=UPI002167E4D5|nr:3-hydroxyacyl-CoA dehydrogenase NAD-binding domain-containing protein [Salinibacter ruber]MCS4149875.1 3-hydroxyacyl-CoA dehydrogenase/enoyl-CoA hydratase/3-hydroxybutyryl-CoA epimerase [Salinibacter ruber]
MPNALSVPTDLLTLTVDETGVATLTLDAPDASVNKISWDTLNAFSDALDVVETHADLSGLVIASGKPDSFIVGANLAMLQTFEIPAEARRLSREAHALGERVRSLPVPTVAALHGPVMGGGLELALNCDYRVASTADATKMALPEVQLGLLPGGGGTQLLPRLVGVQQALGLMLTGKNTYPDKARRIGLVDALIHPPGLRHAARRAARELAAGTRAVERAEQSLGDRLLEGNPVSRRVIYRQARTRTERRTRGNYPAPPRIIDAVRTGMEEGLEAGLDTERQHFGELVFTPESQALVSIFFAKRDAETNPQPEQARPVDTVGMLGAGLMGSGIAQVSAQNGLDVVLTDQSLALAAEGKKAIWSAVTEQEDKGIINTFTRDQIVERVAPTADYAPLQAADVVIEAVPEDLSIKHAVLSEVETVVDADTVLASNTSALPISTIAEGVDDPSRVLGMHYFSPVPDIPLLEIVVTEETSDEALATAYAAGLAQDKTVIVVNDGPGFYTTRILALYMNEALLLFEAGAEIEAVDEAMTDAGFPMGPFELFDLVGLDVAAKITDVMGKALSPERVDISDRAGRLAEADLLGQKTNRGFYEYDADDDADDKDPQGVNDAVYRHRDASSRSTPPLGTIQDRLLLMMVNEAVRCLEDEVLRAPIDGDLGAVFGLGFPPFLGGPFRHVDRAGAASIVDTLQRLADRHGPRFAPADRLQTHAAQDTTFHS